VGSIRIAHLITYPAVNEILVDGCAGASSSGRVVREVSNVRPDERSQPVPVRNVPRVGEDDSKATPIFDSHLQDD
jgi:hypothetical protein